MMKFSDPKDEGWSVITNLAGSTVQLYARDLEMRWREGKRCGVKLVRVLICV